VGEDRLRGKRGVSVEGVAGRIVAAGSDAQGEGGEGDGGGRGARGGGRRAAVDGRGPPADAPCPPPLRLSAEHRPPFILRWVLPLVLDSSSLWQPLDPFIHDPLYSRHSSL